MARPRNRTKRPRGRRRRRRVGNRRRLPYTALRSTPNNGTISIECTRRFVILPRQFNTALGATVKSWIESLTWIATLVLEVLTVLAKFAVEDGQSDAPTSKAMVVGYSQAMCVCVSDLAVTSPICADIVGSGGDQFARLMFREAKMSSVSVSILPNADYGSRGGYYAVALVPLASSTAMPETIHDGYGNLTCNDICRLPNAKFVRADQSVTLNHRFSSHPWVQMGMVADYDDTKKSKWHYNWPPSFLVVMHYSDMATDKEPDKTDTRDDYKISHSLFDIHIRAQCSFRNPGTNVADSVYAKPFLMSPESVLTVEKYNKKLKIHSSHCKYVSPGMFELPGTFEELEAAEGLLAMKMQDVNIASPMLPDHFGFEVV